MTSVYVPDLENSDMLSKLKPHLKLLTLVSIAGGLCYYYCVVSVPYIQLQARLSSLLPSTAAPTFQQQINRETYSELQLQANSSRLQGDNGTAAIYENAAASAAYSASR